jgi:hypothetical protein
MSFGTPGGEQQDQWQPIMLLRMLHHGMNIQEAIDAPSFHSEHWISSFWPRGAKPGKLVIEGRYAPEVLVALKAVTHRQSFSTQCKQLMLASSTWCLPTPQDVCRTTPTSWKSCAKCDELPKKAQARLLKRCWLSMPLLAKTA